jgi:hypothetical protein
VITPQVSQADRTVGLDGVCSDIAMMRTPDGHSKLELTKYHAPAAIGATRHHPAPNTLGLHRVMFAVDDIEDVVARLRTHGAELVGDLAQAERWRRVTIEIHQRTLYDQVGGAPTGASAVAIAQR